MFSKKNHLDVKKSALKVLDCRKDSLNRLKHLKIVLENSTNAETKIFFENNHSHIYYIFYDVFINVENNLKQRAHHRAHREELDIVKFILEKLLIFLPELLQKRWQCHSLGRIMKKFLHCGNSIKLRREGIRLFLLWYQILGDNAPSELDKVFFSLVPGMVPGTPNPYIVNQSQGHSFFGRGQSASVDAYPETSTFYSTTVENADTTGSVHPSDIVPIVPTLGGENQPDDHTRYFLDCLLEFMVSQVSWVKWHEECEIRCQKCFHFLFEKFKKYYLPQLFPNFSWSTTLYAPLLDLPELRYEADVKLKHDTTRFMHKDTLLNCQAVFVRWVTHFTQCLKKTSLTFQPQPAITETQEQNSEIGNGENQTTSQQAANTGGLAPSVELDRDPSSNSLSNDMLSYRDYVVVRETLYASRENINFVHEIFRQAFLMHFAFASTMRKVVAVYREWIQKNTTEKPLFIQEPTTRPEADLAEASVLLGRSANLSIEGCDPSGAAVEELLGLRLRKDSYLKAIHSDYGHLKAGLQNVLNIFITNAANIFLLDLVQDSTHLLDEQVDMCKRVLNIYRYMVMNIQMERRVWEQLLLVLLQITSLVLREVPPVRKEDTLGGRLAPALFQTLIVTWIKANLNVVVSTELWDEFLNVLSSLTQWEELIKEWAKTMETLTRVLAKQVYCLDLNNLPLERLSEQKMKKTRGIKRISMGNLGEKTGLRDPSGVSSSKYRSARENEDTSSQHSETERNSFQMMRSRSGSGSSRKRGGNDQSSSIRRSISDSHLYTKRSSSLLKEHATKSTQRHIFLVPTADDEVCSVTPPFDCGTGDHKRGTYLRQKSRSLDFMGHRAESPCFSESSEYRSRSPSPTPSSGIESTSIKDSPIQIDALVSSVEASCSTEAPSGCSQGETRSIMSGGNTQGWMSDVAIVLWKRMLGALGNINLIKDPNIHAQVLKYLSDLSELLIKIRENLGVTSDNLSSPPPPELVPPVMMITPWLFEAISLSDKYKQGKLLAYELLCVLTLCKHDIPLMHDYLVHFYFLLHSGLMSNDQDVINVIIKSCGPKIFATDLPGSTLLLMDFIYGIDTIVSSNTLKNVPRTEAMSILGALLCHPNLYKEIPMLQTTSELNSIIAKDIKDHITSILFKAGKREPAGLARCIAINSIGIYLYEELKSGTSHVRIKEAVSVLLIAVRFNSKAVAQVASDILLLLCDHAGRLQEKFPDLVRKILEVLSSTLGNLLPSADVPVVEDEKKLILSLIHCLGEWCMSVQQSFLIQEWTQPLSEQSNCPLYSVFKVLCAASTGSKSSLNRARNTTATSEPLAPPPPPLDDDVDPDISLDDLEEEEEPASTSRPSGPSTKESPSTFFKAYVDPQQSRHVIRLAAKNVIYHLVNHLGHFPMGVGAVRLTSLVNEYDDVPSLAGGELSAEVFHAPNIQFLVVNNCSVVSFVEIPAVVLPGGGATAGLMTSNSQVRVIVRDLCGKFSWDSSILHGPPEYCREVSLAAGRPESALGVQPSAQQSSSSLSSSTLSLSGAADEGSGSLSADAGVRHRPADILPTLENSADDLDNLDDLLQYIGHSSPECITIPGQALNAPLKLSSERGQEKEMDVMNLILNQRNLESVQLNRCSNSRSMMCQSTYPPQIAEHGSPFQLCRLLLNQLGITSWEKRSSCDLLKKNEQLLRELRNLDKQKCRETHKIAVIYVAKGQEDKTSILSNCGGSQEFEDFVAGLGWEVELENHLGFLGGLHRNNSCGDTAPYYATSFLEVIFHVSTRMAVSSDKEAINKKVRHLGNDEVHIVWCEHTRDYRKEIIPTDFCDVLIVIYPLQGRLYRIQISRKSGVPFFGPLFNGAVVEHKVLASLVRATAVNANRAKRSLVSLYLNFYEERAKSLESIVQNHKEKTTFEQFAASIYSPAPATKYFIPSQSPGPPSRTDSACSHGIPHLAAALLDAQHSSPSLLLRNRPVSQSTSVGMSPNASPQASLRERPVSTSNSQT